MLSPAYRKPVFIDFGLSKFIREEKGYKSLCRFVGTVNFCCEEMASCVLEKTSKHIDLYYNDLHCLE